MLHKLTTPKTKTKAVRRGRGYGSGGGHTVGRGTKGQKSRSGYTAPRRFFEGGSLPLIKRIPKLKGFSRESFKLNTEKVNITLNMLNDLKEGSTLKVENLHELGFSKRKSKNVTAKILAVGKLEKKITVEGIKATTKAIEMIEKAGGEVK